MLFFCENLAQFQETIALSTMDRSVDEVLSIVWDWLYDLEIWSSYCEERTDCAWGQTNSVLEEKVSVLEEKVNEEDRERLQQSLITFLLLQGKTQSFQRSQILGHFRLEGYQLCTIPYFSELLLWCMFFT